MAQNVYVKEGDLGAAWLKAARSDLGSASMKLGNSSYGSLTSLRYEDGSGTGSVFTADLASDISALEGKLRKLSGKLESYQSLMNSAANEFEEVDKQFREKTDWEKLGMTILKAIGPGGALVATATKAAKGIADGDDIVSILKSASTFVKTHNKWAKQCKNFKKLARMGEDYANKLRTKWFLGLNKMKPANGFTAWSKAGKWADRFRENMRRVEGPFDDLKAGGSKAAWSVLGIGLDFAANSIDNTDEYKRGEISKGRAVTETIVETGVDFFKDWGIGAAVTVGLAATVGAPSVLAVAVGTAVVSKGLDFASEKITYALTGEAKDFTEAVSDLAIDGAMAVGKAVSKAGNKIKSGVKNLLSNVRPPKLGSLLPSF